jgi:predicted secreted protein
MKARSLILLIFLFSTVSVAFSQNQIKSDTSINKTINVKETFDLQFVDWPSPGLCWQLYSTFDSTILSITKVSDEVMKNNFPKGGKWITTLRFQGNQPGDIKLEYFYGRLWLHEKLHKCEISIHIK